jgi:lipoprotein-releasing system permease protein
MYQVLLVLRYLTTRIIPLIAVAAVALCVTLVVVVVSVMTGFLDMLRNSGRTLVGDVVVSFDIVGIPYYEELIADIEALPEAEAASPVVESFGLLRMPYGVGGGNRVETVQVWGIDPSSLDRVIDFSRIIYWKAPRDEAARTAMRPDDPRLEPGFDRLADAMAMRNLVTDEPGIVVGIEISPFNHRQRDGSYRTGRRDAEPWDPSYWMPATGGALLTLVPVSESGQIDLKGERKQSFRIVNEFQTGVFQIDSQRVLMPLKEAQALLRLDEAPIYDLDGERDEDGRPTRLLGVSPARATTILVKAAPGIAPTALRDAVGRAYEAFRERKLRDPETMRPPPPFVDVRTWEERLRDLIGPVEKERALMRVLFSLIYVVCAGLVLAIFWAIVQEKTRDIGILRSIGASRLGILLVFLAYGLVIGTVGSALGLALAWVVVGHINEIHDAMGRPAPALAWMSAFAGAAGALVAAVVAARRESVLYGLLWSILCLALGGVGLLLLFHKGITIWDPSVYYFSRIPSSIDLADAILTMVFAIVFSVFGAAIPAAKAADTDPVRSLRYE